MKRAFKYLLISAGILLLVAYIHAAIASYYFLVYKPEMEHKYRIIKVDCMKATTGVVSQGERLAIFTEGKYSMGQMIAHNPDLYNECKK